MEKYIIFGIFLATLQGSCSLPQHRRVPGRHQHKDTTNERDEADGAKVVWGAKCSSKTTFVYPGADLIIECEVYVPIGTTLTWYKDGSQLHPQRQVEMVEEATNEVEWIDTESVPNVSQASKVHISSLIYIDCASSNDKGEYTLAVKPPKGQVQHRHFAIKILTPNYMLRNGTSCKLGREIMSFIPRVYLYAKQILAQMAYDAIVPCRSIGIDIIQGWRFNNNVIKNSKKYQILPSGDLVVKNVTPEDRGLYFCRATSTIEPTLFDETLTYFYPHSQESGV